RQLTSQAGALLVVDEVMTGFRLAPGGAVERFGLEPDLVTWGKYIGGGFPVGAYGGRAELMELVSPVGDVYQAGTLSGNPVAMAAGAATLRELGSQPELYVRLEESSGRLERGLLEGAESAELPVRVNRVGSMITVFFNETPVEGLAGAMASDAGRFAGWFQALLKRGVYWPPSQFEAAFVSAAHDQQAVDRVVAAAADAFLEVAG